MGDAILIFFYINYIFCFMIFIQINILKESPISISHLSKGIITVIIANRRTNWMLYKVVIFEEIQTNIV